MRLNLLKNFGLGLFALWLSVFGLSAAAHAGAFSMGGLTATLSTDHVTQSEASRAANGQVRGDPAFAAPDVSRLDFTYRYSRNRTQQNLQTFLERTRDPAARADLERILEVQPRLIEDVRDAIRGYGLEPNNVADAYALWWINSWAVANKNGDDPDLGTIAVVKLQARSALAASPSFANTNDAQRQEFAEALLLHSAMLASAFDQSANNPAALDQLATAARQGALATGLDLTGMQLTRNGFVIGEGALSNAPTSQEAPSLASSDSGSEDDSEGSSGLGLIFAAGAGLGLLALGALALRRKA